MSQNGRLIGLSSSVSTRVARGPLVCCIIHTVRYSWCSYHCTGRRSNLHYFSCSTPAKQRSIIRLVEECILINTFVARSVNEIKINCNLKMWFVWNSLLDFIPILKKIKKKFRDCRLAGSDVQTAINCYTWPEDYGGLLNISLRNGCVRVQCQWSQAEQTQTT